MLEVRTICSRHAWFDGGVGVILVPKLRVEVLNSLGDYAVGSYAL
jgi:hypothetical protein